ncbi:MAG: pyrroline-5-carboxylate reductase [Lachnospiraceae bacterium]|nr:pyrroline-5-carboxylate reductase [Lachnospiraceae bacterium]
MSKIGFIGMGNMGYAMLSGCLKQFQAEEILFTDVNTERMSNVTLSTKVRHVDSNAELANNVKYIVLAIKPQYFSSVLKNIENVVTKDHVIISIAPGISREDIKDSLGYDARVVRAMPNTPALLGEGMTGVCYDSTLFTYEEKEVIASIFKSFGKFRIIEERLMSAVTCASGSSPAYVYMFIEAMADGVVKHGLPRDVAYEMVAQTVAGAAKMVLETGKHPGELKDMVCSPGGTTIAGVAALEEEGFRNSIIKACDACYEISEGFKRK